MNSNDETPQAEESRERDWGHHRHGHHHHGRGRGRQMLKFIPLFIIFVLAKAGVVMLLWNLLAPDVFHLSEMTYVQALELTVLAKLLFGFGGGFRGPGPFFGGGRGRWMNGRWASLSPEEREKFREELKRRFS